MVRRRHVYLERTTLIGRSGVRVAGRLSLHSLRHGHASLPIASMDAGVAAQDHRFAWLVGMQLTTTAAVVGTLLGARLAR